MRPCQFLLEVVCLVTLLAGLVSLLEARRSVIKGLLEIRQTFRLAFYSFLHRLDTLKARLILFGEL